MSRMSGILILSNRLKVVTNLYVLHCFEHHRIIHISSTRCQIEMGFGLKCSNLKGQEIWILPTCDSFPLIMSQIASFELTFHLQVVLIKPPPPKKNLVLPSSGISKKFGRSMKAPKSTKFGSFFQPFFLKNTQSWQNWMLSIPQLFSFNFWLGSAAESNTFVVFVFCFLPNC